MVSIFWNAFLSTLSHAPTIEPTSFLDSFQQYTDTLPEPLHERAAEFVDSIYKTSLPLHERAAQFADSLKLPLVSVEPEVLPMFHEQYRECQDKLCQSHRSAHMHYTVSW